MFKYHEEADHVNCFEKTENLQIYLYQNICQLFYGQFISSAPKFWCSFCYEFSTSCIRREAVRNWFASAINWKLLPIQKMKVKRMWTKCCLLYFKELRKSRPLHCSTSRHFVVFRKLQHWMRYKRISYKSIKLIYSSPLTEGQVHVSCSLHILKLF